MKLNFSDIGTFEEQYLHGKCFVDGREMRLVVEADTESGEIVTYDVFGDNKAHSTRESGSRDNLILLRKAGRDVFYRGEILAERIRGRVQLFKRGEDVKL